MTKAELTTDKVFSIPLEELLNDNSNKYEGMRFEAKGTVIGPFSSSPASAFIQLSQELPEGIDLVCSCDVKIRKTNYDGFLGDPYYIVGVGYSVTKFSDLKS